MCEHSDALRWRQPESLKRLLIVLIQAPTFSTYTLSCCVLLPIRIPLVYVQPLVKLLGALTQLLSTLLAPFLLA